MEKKLLTLIVVAVFGSVIAFVACNFLLGPIESVTFRTVDSTVNTNLTDPDPEVFNYRALNPTVEVYVGECTEYDSYGNCIEETGNNPNVNQPEAPEETP